MYDPSPGLLPVRKLGDISVEPSTFLKIAWVLCVWLKLKMGLSACHRIESPQLSYPTTHLSDLTRTTELSNEQAAARATLSKT